MSCWERLGISPTSDQRAIRRAYAKQLKITRPDEDPQGYQALREAFDYALEIAPEQDSQAEIWQSAEVDARTAREKNSEIPDRSFKTIVAEMQQVLDDEHVNGVVSAVVERWQARRQQIMAFSGDEKMPLLAELLAFLRENHLYSPTLWCYLDQDFDLAHDQTAYSLLSDEEKNDLEYQRFLHSLGYDAKAIYAYLRYLIYRNQEPKAGIESFWFFFQYDLELFEHKQYQLLRHYIAEILRKTPQLVGDFVHERWTTRFNLYPSRVMPQANNAIEIRSPQRLRKYIIRLYQQNGGKGIDNAWLQLAPYIGQFDTKSQRYIYEFLHYLAENYDDIPRALCLVWRQQYQALQQNVVDSVLRAETLPSEMASPLSSQNTLRVDDILYQVQQVFQQGGSQALVEYWGQLTQLLSQLPLEDSDEISWRLCQFLNEHLIEHPVLWWQWSTYFGWHNDYRFAHYFSSDELDVLQERLRRAEWMIEQDNPPKKDIREYPITHAIAQKLAQGWNKCLAIICMTLIYPWIYAELPSSDRGDGLRYITGERNDVNYPAIFRGLGRGVILLYLIYYFAIKHYHIPSIYTHFIGFFMVISILSIGTFALKNWILKRIETKWLVKLITIGIPLSVLIYIPLFSDSLHGTSAKVILCLLTLSYSYTFTKIDSEFIGVGLGLIGTVSFYALIPNQSSYMQSLFFISVLLWMNINRITYLYYNKPFNQLYAQITAPFAQIPYDWGLLLYPLRLIISFVLWLFFIPSHIMLLMQRTQNLWLLVELLLGGLLVLLPLGDTKDSLFFFYPAVLVAYCIHLLLTKGILSILRR